MKKLKFTIILLKITPKKIVYYANILPVRSSEVATGILVFVLFETGTRVIIMDTVLVSERLRGEFFNWVGFVWCWWRGMVWGGGWVVWGWGSIGTGGSDGHEGGENDSLKNYFISYIII